MGYQTKQKNLLLRFLKEHETEQLTIEEISAQMPEGMGKSTLYRLMNQFTEQGEVLRFRGGDQKSVRYQLVNCEHGGCKDHFHAQCMTCGRLFHLHCEFLNDFGNHLGDCHQFQINPSQTILYGVCKTCVNDDSKETCEKGDGKR